MAYSESPEERASVAGDGFPGDRLDELAGGNEEWSIETEVLGKVVNGVGPDTKKPSRDEKVLSAFRIKNGRGDRPLKAFSRYLN